MAHHVRLFVGEPQAFALYLSEFPAVSRFRLTADSKLVFLPVDDDLQDAFHAHYGTGDWGTGGGPRLSSTDLAFAARASNEAPLGYIETDYQGGDGWQHAILWRAGNVAVGPITLDIQQSRLRPTTLWPINIVLRALGTAATPSEDEFVREGLGAYRSNDDICERCLRFQ